MPLKSEHGCDIFISYRHNDNRNGWVTEFAEALQIELAAAIKTPLSVYFDKNPHDGLLETHQVDESLKHKLRCVIFIPIVSQTYCDTASFAWQHEFLVFNRQAAQDDLGKHVRLLNGNVSSRVIPVRIHDIDPVDVAILEKELGPLRSIDFVYRTEGVSRPLLASELDAKANLNHTFYRDQLYKVVRSVKDIVNAVQSPASAQTLKAQSEETRVAPQSAAQRNRLAIPAAILGALAVVALSWYFLRNPDSTKVATINSIAVLPFSNMSNDPEQEPFCDGTTEQVISSLSRLPDLRVIARTSVLQYKNTTKSIAEIGRELNVTHVLESSVRKAGNRLRVTAQLIAVNDESHLWSEDYDNKNVEDIFLIQDEVAARIAGSLRKTLRPDERENMKSERPSSMEAYEHYVRGEYIHDTKFWVTLQDKDFKEAEYEFLQAIALDSTYAPALAGLSNLYDSRSNVGSNGDFAVYRAKADKYAAKAMALNPELPDALIAAFQSKYHNCHTEADVDSAYQLAYKAFRLTPNGGNIANEFAFLNSLMGLPETSRKLSDLSISLTPNSGYRLATRGWMEMNAGAYDEAEKFLSRSMQLDSNTLAPNFMFSVYMRKGRVDQAEKALARLKKSDVTTDVEQLEAILLASKGKKKEALRLWNRIPVTPLLQMPEVMDELERRASNNPLGLNRVTLQDTMYNYLRSNPRFQRLQKLIDERISRREAKYGKLEVPGALIAGRRN